MDKNGNANISDYDLGNFFKPTALLFGKSDSKKIWRVFEPVNILTETWINKQWPGTGRGSCTIKYWPNRMGILMDDEWTFVKADYKQIPGAKFYKTDARGNIPSRFNLSSPINLLKKLF